MSSHSHNFLYEFTDSNIRGITPHNIQFQIDGDVTLTELIERFEHYVVSTGFVLPDHTHIGLVTDLPPKADNSVPIAYEDQA